MNEQPDKVTDQSSDDLSYSENAPVTGQGRMDAAWGSKDGDESTTAQVTNNTASVGYVFEQIYKPWNGTLNPRWMRNWAILRHHVLGIFRKGHRPWSLPTKLFIVVVFIASLADVGLTLLAALIGSPELHTMWGVNRDNLYGHVLGFFPRNMLYYPILAALLVGGVISEDRYHGTSALYFSRPVSRFDYVMMKYISVAMIQAFVVLLTLMVYYFCRNYRHGSWMGLDNRYIPAVPRCICRWYSANHYLHEHWLGFVKCIQGEIFPGIGLVAIVLGSKTLAVLVSNLFERDVMYLLSPYDCLAHVGQALVGTQTTYDQYSWTWSLASLVLINAFFLYILSSRVASMEVTRE